jgi:3-oxoacyl-[acyl-carrier protein] reductase
MTTVIIVGASSELAHQVSLKLSDNFQVINLSRKLTKIDNSINVLIPDYSPSEINKFLETLSSSNSHSFIFFNGISDSEIFINISDEEISSILETNLLAPILFTKLALKKFILKKTKYIYLTSTRALNGDRGIALYSTTKSALKYFARSLALEYGNFKQYFHVVSLGIFDYGLVKKVNANTLGEIKKNSAIKEYVDVNQLVKTIEFIIKTDASTGSVIHADNGYF